MPSFTDQRSPSNLADPKNSQPIYIEIAEPGSKQMRDESEKQSQSSQQDKGEENENSIHKQTSWLNFNFKHNYQTTQEEEKELYG